jgi:V-type H+-transporting ATPase subunit E
MQNQARLKVLKAREEHIRNVLEEARKKLIATTSNEGEYQKVLEKLIAQGLFQLLEKDVTIRCRQQDVRLVENCIATAVAEYQAATSKPVNVTVDREVFLQGGCGGVELLTNRGKIKVTNTLDSRLELISHQLLPSVRVALFGRNPNRKFDD